jgi:hypothetical protein
MQKTSRFDRNDVSYDFYCRLTNDIHLINNPRQLPCKAFGCLECIKKNLDYFKIFYCKICSGEHKLDDLESMLIRNPSYERSLRQKIREVSNELKSQLDHKIQEVKGNFNFFRNLLSRFFYIFCLKLLKILSNNYLADMFENSQYVFNNIFEFMMQDIELRVESLFLELEKQKYLVLEQVETLDNKLNQNTDVLQTQLNDLKEITQKPDSNDPELLNRLTLIQDNLNETSKNIDFITEKLNFFSRVESKMPKDIYKTIGRITSPFNDVDPSLLENASIKMIDLSEKVDNLTSLCAYGDDYMIALDNYTTSMIIFDKEFNFVLKQSLNDIFNLRKNHLIMNTNLYGILCSNNLNSDYIYINNMEKSEIIILEKNLQILKAIIKPFERIPKEKPVEIGHHYEKPFEIDILRNNLYVLDNMNKSILKYSLDGIYEESIQLETVELDMYKELIEKLDKHHKYINIPNSFAISNQKIAILLPIQNEIHIHALNGKLSHIIKSCYEHLSMCFVNDNLALYCRLNGHISIFKENQNGEYEIIFKKFYHRLVQKENKFSYSFNHKSIMFIDSKLIILFSENSTLAYLPI